MSKNFDLRIEEFGALLFDKRKNIVLNANKVGVFVLLSIKNGLTVNEIIRKLETKYPDVGKTKLAEDVSNFIKYALKEGIIEWK